MSLGHIYNNILKFWYHNLKKSKRLVLPSHNACLSHLPVLQ